MIYRPKPFSPELNRSHPLVRGLRYYFCYNEGFGQVAQNLAGLGNATVETSLQGDWSSGIDGASIESSAAATGAAVTAPAGFSPEGSDWSFFVRFRISESGAKEVFTVGDTLSSNLWLLRVTSTIRLQFFFRDLSGNNVSPTTVNSLSVGQWHDFMGVRQGGTLSLYLDGSYESQATNASLGSFTATPTHRNLIGSALTGGLSLNGNVSVQSLSLRAFSAQEVAEFSADPFAIVRPQSRIYMYAPQAPAGNRRRRLLIGAA